MHANPDEEAGTTLRGRTAGAFVSLLFSSPVVFLLWFLFNTQLGLFTTGFIPAAYLVYIVLVLAACGFIFPRLAGELVGKLYGLLHWVAKLW